MSDSAKFNITSRNDGMDPVVMALILGMVIVGDAACAVKGMAEPLEINLWNVVSKPFSAHLGSILTFV